MFHMSSLRATVTGLTGLRQKKGSKTSCRAGLEVVLLTQNSLRCIIMFETRV